jgi:RimJ/RimL family protein N-acetyltransferase
MNSTSEIDIVDLSSKAHLFQRGELKEFLGVSIRDSERAHTGKGLWDIGLEAFSEKEKVDILGETCLNAFEAHFHVSRMSVAVDGTTSKPVAALCGFYYPEYKLGKTFDCISTTIYEKYPSRFSSFEDARKIWDAVNLFLDDSFPEDVDYGNSWMIEAVYTSPEYRGQGLASKLMTEVLKKGKTLGYHKSLITCAVGNEKARKIYEKCGYKLVGTGNSEECMKAIGSTGFYVLRKDL